MNNTDPLETAIKIAIIPAIIMTIITIIFVVVQIKSSQDQRAKEWNEIKQRAAQNQLSQEELVRLIEHNRRGSKY